jgi:C1A family cysteine protease
MRAHCPAVYDQGQLGSCTANAIGGAFEFDQIKEKVPHVWRPARLFIYYNERAIEGDVSQDAGAQIRDGIKSVASQGACSEDLWTYSDDTTSASPKFAQKPPQDCYDNAAKHLVTSYSSVPQAMSQIKGCLASGFPVIFGFTVYESFESQQVASTGILPMPGSTEKVLGGHAVLCVGYDDTKTVTNPDGSTSTGMVLVRNSWSASWGEAGYFWMPGDYIANSNLASDLWTIRFVQSTPTSCATQEKGRGLWPSALPALVAQSEFLTDEEHLCLPNRGARVRVPPGALRPLPFETQTIVHSGNRYA